MNLQVLTVDKQKPFLDIVCNSIKLTGGSTPGSGAPITHIYGPNNIVTLLEPASSAMQVLRPLGDTDEIKEISSDFFYEGRELEWNYNGAFSTSGAGTTIQFYFSLDGTLAGSIFYSPAFVLPNTLDANYFWTLKCNTTLNKLGVSASSDFRNSCTLTYTPILTAETDTAVTRMGYTSNEAVDTTVDHTGNIAFYGRYLAGLVGTNTWFTYGGTMKG